MPTLGNTTEDSYLQKKLNVCGAELQTRQHITLECTLGHGRHTEWGWLTGTPKGINKLIEFIKPSNAFNKPALAQGHAMNRQSRGGDKMGQEASPQARHRC